MTNMSREEAKRPLISWTLKCVVIIGGLSWLASGWLSSTTRDRDSLSRLTANISNGLDDPLTTGSVARNAGATKLDPCTSPRR